MIKKGNKYHKSNGGDELNRLKFELKKKDDTIAFLFKETKSVSKLVSGFFYDNFCENNLNVTKDYVLSSSRMAEKLELIFKEFEDLKNKSNKQKKQKNEEILEKEGKAS